MKRVILAALLAALPALAQLAPTASPTPPAEAIVEAEVEVGSTGNAAPVRVVNDSDLPAEGIAVSLIASPPAVRNPTLERETIAALASGDEEELELRFDIAEDVEPGRLGDLRLRISAATGKLSTHEVVFRLTAVAPEAEAPVEEPSPALTENTNPPVLWLTRIEMPTEGSRSGLFENSDDPVLAVQGRGYTIRDPGKHTILSYAADVPKRIVMGQSFEASVELLRIFAPNGYVQCRDPRSGDGIGGPQLRLRQSYGRSGDPQFSVSADGISQRPVCEGKIYAESNLNVWVGVQSQTISVRSVYSFVEEKQDQGRRSFWYRADSEAKPRASIEPIVEPAAIYSTNLAFDEAGYAEKASDFGLVLITRGMRFFYTPIADASEQTRLPAEHLHPPPPPAEEEPAPDQEPSTVSEAGAAAPPAPGVETAPISDAAASSVGAGSAGSQAGAAAQSGERVTGNRGPATVGAAPRGPAGTAADQPGQPDQPGDVSQPAAPAGPADPAIAALITEWLSAAEPPNNVTEGADFRYDPWGRFVGSALTGTAAPQGNPDDAGVQLPIEYVWDRRETLDSVDHCTLGEYVSRRLISLGVEDCRGRYRPSVPDVIGASRAEAARLLEAFDFSPAFSTGGPAPAEDHQGLVADLSLTPGQTADRGSRIGVTLFGPVANTVTLPDFSGMPLDRAVAQAEQAGLRVEQATGIQAVDPDDAGRVQTQVPLPGTRLRKGDPVTLTVYAAPAPVVKVPNLVGMDARAARQAIAGLQVTPQFEEIGPAPIASRARRVVSQEPAAGTVVNEGSLISVRHYGAVRVSAAPAPSPKPPAAPTPNPAAAPTSQTTTTGGSGLSVVGVWKVVARTVEGKKTPATGDPPLADVRANGDLIIGEARLKWSIVRGGRGIDVQLPEGPFPLTILDLTPTEATIRVDREFLEMTGIILHMVRVSGERAGDAPAPKIPASTPSPSAAPSSPQVESGPSILGVWKMVSATIDGKTEPLDDYGSLVDVRANGDMIFGKDRVQWTLVRGGRGIDLQLPEGPFPLTILSVTPTEATIRLDGEFWDETGIIVYMVRVSGETASDAEAAAEPPKPRNWSQIDCSAADREGLAKKRDSPPARFGVMDEGYVNASCNAFPPSLIDSSTSWITIRWIEPGYDAEDLLAYGVAEVIPPMLMRYCGDRVGPGYFYFREATDKAVFVDAYDGWVDPVGQARAKRFFHSLTEQVNPHAISRATLARDLEQVQGRNRARALYSAGLMYLRGMGVEKDLDKARRLMQQAADAGDYNAPNYLKNDRLWQ